MTESTFTLDEAKKVLARQECELDIQGGPLYSGYNPWGHQRPKRLDPLPLGHDLAKVFHNDCSGDGLKGYKCLVHGGGEC